MGSALGLSTFSAKAGNILNQDGGPAIYSAGNWNFENSSGTTTFTISDAGAATVGAAAGTGASALAHVVNGKSLTIQLSSAGAATAPTSTSNAYYLGVGRYEANVNSYRLLGFGYRNTETHYPAFFGYKETNNGGATCGSLVFGTRSVTTDTEPSIAMEIASTGAVTAAVAGTNTKINGSLSIGGNTAASQTGQLSMKSVTINANSTATIGTISDSFNNGCMVFAISSYGSAGMFHALASVVTLSVGSGAGGWGASVGANSFNLYASGGNLVCQNNTASQRIFSFMMFTVSGGMLA
jgi:hypothetical protein